ncbi:MAG: SMC-Scp complex subunit ScpB [Candidatus Diapherotrites archaeon]|nr:SMC-Scp complex subunit ScpB [Candidatus Diapherotrites archaeon]
MKVIGGSEEKGSSVLENSVSRVNELNIAVSRMEKEKIIEAALFMSPKPLTLEELNLIAKVNSRIETLAMMKDLMNFYNSRKSALEVVELPVGYQMRVKEEYEDEVAQFAQNSMFNRGVMKTLALIAYKQPVVQSSVVKLRNNKAYDHLKLLLDEGFIRKEPRGRSFVLTTTTKFIEYFGKDFGKSKAKSIVAVAPSSSDTRSHMGEEVNKVMEQNAGNISKE